MDIKQLLAFYFRPLISYATEEVAYKNHLLQQPLWFFRKLELRSKNIIEQLKKQQDQPNELDEKFLAKLVVMINDKKEFSFTNLDEGERQKLLNLCYLEGEKTNDNAQYATSLLITLLMRTNQIDWRSDIIRLLKDGETKLNYHGNYFLLKILSKDLLKNNYIEFCYANFTGLDQIISNFSGLNLEGISLSHANLEECTFRHACLQEADLSCAKIKHTDFTGAHLGKVNLTHATIKKIFIDDCYIVDTNFNDATLTELHFEKSILFLPNFTNAKLKTCRFSPEQIEKNEKLNELLSEKVIHKFQEQSDDNKQVLHKAVKSFLENQKQALPDGDPYWPHDPGRWRYENPWSSDEVEEKWCELTKDDEIYKIVNAFICQTSNTMSYVAKSFEFARLKKAYEEGKLGEFINRERKQSPFHRGEAGSVIIEKIMVLHNLKLWSGYQTSKKSLQQELAKIKIAKPLQKVTWHSRGILPQLPVLDEEVGECWLFHGTKQKVMPLITSGGFSTEFAECRPFVGYGALGKGVYTSDGFAKVATYVNCNLCEQNQCECDEKPSYPKAVFLNRVLLGNIYIDRRKQRTHEKYVPQGYHSSWGPAKTFDAESKFSCNEFAIGDVTQIYPEFCIFYRDNPLKLNLQEENSLKEQTYLPAPTEWGKTNQAEEYQTILRHLKDYYRLLAMEQLEQQLVILMQLNRAIDDLPVKNKSIESLLTQINAEEKFLNSVLHQANKLAHQSGVTFWQNKNYQYGYFFLQGKHFAQAIESYGKALAEHTIAPEIYLEKAAAYRGLKQGSLFLENIHRAYLQQPEWCEQYLQDNPHFNLENYYEIALQQLEKGYQDTINRYTFLKRLLKILQTRLLNLIDKSNQQTAAWVRCLLAIVEYYQQAEDLNSKTTLFWLRTIGVLIFNESWLILPKQKRMLVLEQIEAIKTDQPYYIGLLGLILSLKASCALKANNPIELIEELKTCVEFSRIPNHFWHLFAEVNKFILQQYTDTPTEQPQLSVTVDLIIQGIIQPLQRQLLTFKKIDWNNSLTSQLLEHVWYCYLNARETWFVKTKFASIKNQCRLPLFYDLPSSNGWSPRYEFEQQAWLEQVSNFFEKTTSACEVQGYPTQQKCYFPAELVKSCFDDKGDFVGDKVYSSENSQVRKITLLGQHYFLKSKRGNKEVLMGREYAAEQLHRLLGGSCQVAAGWPLKLIYRKGGNERTHYVWLSQAIDGPSLGDVMMNRKENRQNISLEDIDSECYTQLFILAHLSSPEDGQPENFKLVKERNGITRLIAIDNGQCFVNPDRTEERGILWNKRLETLLNIKTMIYFLPQMDKLLDTNVLNRIKLLNPAEVIHQWRDKLQELNDIFGESIGDVDEKIILCVWERLQHLHNFLINCPPNYSVTGIELLEKLDWVMASHCVRLKGKISTPQDFYTLIDSTAYEISKTAGKAVSTITASQLKSRSINPEGLQRSLKIRPAYFMIVNWKNLKEENQHFMWQLLLATAKAYEKTPNGFIELNLSGCKVIRGEELIELLKRMPNLERLNITKSKQFHIGTVQTILATKINERLQGFNWVFEVLCPKLYHIRFTLEAKDQVLNINPEKQRRILVAEQTAKYLQYQTDLFNHLLGELSLFGNSAHATEWLGQLGGILKLQKVDLQQKVLQSFVRLLKSNKLFDRYRTMQTLFQLAPLLHEKVNWEPVVQTLIQLLDDTDSYERIGAARALIKLAPILYEKVNWQRVIITLVNFKNSDEYDQIKVANALIELALVLHKKFDWQPVVQTLTQLLEDKNASIRIDAAETLIKLAPLPHEKFDWQPVEQTLVKLLDEAYPYHPIEAAETLIKLAPLLPEKFDWQLVVNTLIYLVENRQMYEAASTLIKLDPLLHKKFDWQPVVQTLVKLLENDDTYKQKNTAKVLIQLAPVLHQQFDWQPVLKTLVQLLDSTDLYDQVDVANELIKLTPIMHLQKVDLRQRVLQSLLRLLKSKNKYVKARTAAAKLLIQLAPLLHEKFDWQQTLENLIPLLEDKHVNVRIDAAKALIELIPILQQKIDWRQISQTLIPSIKDENLFIQECVAKALLQLAPEQQLQKVDLQQRVLQSLLHFLNGKNEYFRILAAKALIALAPVLHENVDWQQIVVKALLGLLGPYFTYSIVSKDVTETLNQLFSAENSLIRLQYLCSKDNRPIITADYFPAEITNSIFEYLDQPRRHMMACVHSASFWSKSYKTFQRQLLQQQLLVLEQQGANQVTIDNLVEQSKLNK